MSMLDFGVFLPSVILWVLSYFFLKGSFPKDQTITFDQSNHSEIVNLIKNLEYTDINEVFQKRYEIKPSRISFILSLFLLGVFPAQLAWLFIGTKPLLIDSILMVSETEIKIKPRFSRSAHIRIYISAVLYIVLALFPAVFASGFSNFTSSSILSSILFILFYALSAIVYLIYLRYKAIDTSYKASVERIINIVHAEKRQTKEAPCGICGTSSPLISRICPKCQLYF